MNKERAVEVGKHILKTGDSLKETSEKLYISYSYTTVCFSAFKSICPKQYKKAKEKQCKKKVDKCRSVRK